MALADNETAAAIPPRDLSKGVIVILSGGPIDLTNPQDVRDRMDQIIEDINAEPYVLANTGGAGLIYKLIENQPNIHIHQAEWRNVLASPDFLAASPLILVGHSNGGAAVMDLAHSLNDLGKTVDFAFTADTVFTLDDYGNVYDVPANVKLNLNSYTVPVYPAWFFPPFPYGQTNSRETDHSVQGILNIGLPFPEGGAFAHHDAFYDLAGGDLADGAYTYPELIRDSCLAILKGASNQDVMQLAQDYLQTLADKIPMPIYIESTNIDKTLEPGNGADTTDTVRLSDSDTAAIREHMMALERIRLSMAQR